MADQDKGNSAMELPPGSFDLGALHRVGEEAAAMDDPASGRELGLSNINRRIDKEVIPGALPNHKVVQVERVIQPGVERQRDDGNGTEIVGRIVVTENVQVFDPDSVKEPEPEPAGGLAPAGVVAREGVAAPVHVADVSGAAPVTEEVAVG